MNDQTNSAVRSSDAFSLIKSTRHSCLASRDSCSRVKQGLFPWGDFQFWVSTTTNTKNDLRWLCCIAPDLPCFQPCTREVETAIKFSVNPVDWQPPKGWREPLARSPHAVN